MISKDVYDFVKLYLIFLILKLEGIFYINAYGHEIFPSPNPDFIANLCKRDVLIYSCGSLWTR